MASNEFPDELISIIGSNFAQPLADMIHNLVDLDSPDANPVKTSGAENGYSVAVVLLLTAMFESYVMRARHHLADSEPSSWMGKRVPSYVYISHMFPKYPLRNELLEVHVLRDAITHNHLWVIGYINDLDADGLPVMRLVYNEMDVRSGDKKYESVVDVESMKTRTRELNVNPLLVQRCDVYAVFSTIWNSLLFLEEQDHNLCPVSNLRVHFRESGSVLFGSLIQELERAL